ncbi:MAG: PAS domain S-box protein [Sneathiella sp.]
MNSDTGLFNAIQDFSLWVGADHSTVKEALSAIVKGTGSDAATFSILSKNQDWLSFIEACPDLNTAAPDFLDDIKKSVIHCSNSKKLSGVDSSGYTTFKYCLSFKTSIDTSDEHATFSLWKNSPIQLGEPEMVFLKMALSVVHQRYLDIQEKAETNHFLSETLNAIDEAYIVYDRDEKVISYNQRHADLFPSLEGSLKVGVSYETLLREQIIYGQLDEAVIGKEDWIKERRRQLKIHGFMLEQKFLDGRTIRLTNYRTKSGNTVSLRTDITELFRARQKSQESEIASHALLTGAPIPLIIVVDGICVYGNSYADNLFSVEDGGLIGLQTRSFYWDPANQESVIDLLNETKTNTSFKLNIKTATGQKKIVSATSSKITYDGKKAFFSSLLDITKATTIQNALETSEKQNRDLLELIPDAIIVQVNGKLAYANQNAVRIFRAKDKASLIGTESLDLIPTNERDRTLTLRERAKNSSDSVASNTIHLRLDGSTFHSESFVKSIIWNEKPGTVVIIKDASKRRLYENTLLQKEEEMSWAQEIGNFGHWRKNVLDDTLFWSDGLFRLHGMDPKLDTLTLERARNFIVEEDRVKLRNQIDQTVATQKMHHFEVTIQQDDGEKRILAGSIQPEFGADGSVVSVFGVSQDVTRQRMMEENFRQSQKMDAIGQLTGGVAHDFNNLLAIIQGNTELLLELTVGIGPNEKRQLEAILKASERGADLTTSLLAFSRKQILRSTTVKLDEQIQNVTDFLQRTLGQKIQLKSLNDDQLWPCHVDADQVENALLNLALNARDAMPEGGTLTIETKNIICEQKSTGDIDEFKAGNYVVLCVTDTGSGIEKDDLKRVFDPFFTTKDAGHGSGLGLSMVYGFAKQSGGQATVTSTKGSGTTVKIYLPKILDA